MYPNIKENSDSVLFNKATFTGFIGSMGCYGLSYVHIKLIF